ncbi:unnamed protein product [Nesidiocoris tenuis]|uniref:Uncharacterized protein n=1 Tax=Nesidiocoris tenuis TaxID=355587 RepID=A0A6H5H776_9HEMI|nr:unnamed protein product [Nesidiocoris tenuis]
MLKLSDGRVHPKNLKEFYRIGQILSVVQYYLTASSSVQSVNLSKVEVSNELNFHQRWMVYMTWQRKLVTVLEEERRLAQESLIVSQKALQEVSDYTLYKIQGVNPDIIGLTTTAAAQHYSALYALGGKNWKCSRGHGCSSTCNEPCPPCSVLVFRKLKCNHVQKIQCYLGDDRIHCNYKLAIELKRCGHENTVRCGFLFEHGESILRCNQKLVATLNCGHKLRYKCGTISAEDILNVACLEKCNRININCPEGHECDKKCSDPCGKCDHVVKKKLNCGHSMMVKCCESVDDVACHSPCSRQLQCRHICRNLCSQPCGHCREMLKAREENLKTIGEHWHRNQNIMDKINLELRQQLFNHMSQLQLGSDRTALFPLTTELSAPVRHHPWRPAVDGAQPQAAAESEIVPENESSYTNVLTDLQDQVASLMQAMSLDETEEQDEVFEIRTAINRDETSRFDKISARYSRLTKAERDLDCSPHQFHEDRKCCSDIPMLFPDSNHKSIMETCGMRGKGKGPGPGPGPGPVALRPIGRQQCSPWCSICNFPDRLGGTRRCFHPPEVPVFRRSGRVRTAPGSAPISEGFSQTYERGRVLAQGSYPVGRWERESRSLCTLDLFLEE